MAVASEVLSCYGRLAALTADLPAEDELARKLIEARQYVLDSDWGEVQPRADAQNAFLERRSWEEYAAWHLGLTEGVTDQTKARYGFVFGDFRRVHRTALIACVYRAAEWRHKDVERAAREVLSLYCCGPAGGGGVRMRVTDRIRTLSFLVPRGRLAPRVTLLGLEDAA